MSKVKIGVIGCGTIACGAHIPAYTNCANAEIKYFCDIIPERAQAEADKYGSGIVTADYHDILADPEVEAVSVCTPNLMHSIISIDALRAGKAVLCEKPAARIYSEALEMQKAQKETGKMLNIGVVNRFNAAVNAVRERIEAGELGEVYHVFLNFRAQRGIPGIGGAFTNKAIAGGGTLIDWGVHRLDIVMYCMGDPKPKSVSGAAYCKLGVDIKNYVYNGMWAENTRDVNGTYDVDDSVSAFIRSEGPVITLEGAWAQNIGEREDYIDFIGTKAGIRLWYSSNFKIYGVRDGKLWEDEPAYEVVDMFQNEIDSFVRSVRSGEKLPSNIDYAVLTSQIMQGIYDSSDAGREIVF